MNFDYRKFRLPAVRVMNVCLLFLLLLAPVCAQTPAAQTYLKYQKVMVPMRDGVHLETVILTPANEQRPLAILLTRTPYGVPTQPEAAEFRPQPDAVDWDQYIRVIQNIRGRFGSEGVFEMQHPPRSLHDPKAVDEVTDAWDTVDWLIKNVPQNNGRAGIVGTSYPGWLVMEAALNPHPALKAAIELASPQDMFLNDDFHHNGAFRLSYGFEYSALLETSKTENYNFAFDRGDTYDWYLNLGPLSNADARYFHGKIPTWENFVSHPNRDRFWETQAVSTYLSAPKLPIMHVSGWWDQEDMVGPQSIYAALERHDPHHLNYFVAGPWNHGQWNRRGWRLGPLQFGSDTSLAYRRDIQSKWFAYWLQDKGSRDFPEAQVFQTGANRWQSYDAWPPRRGITPRRIYLQPAGKLSFDKPAAGARSFDQYVSDSANPVPYRPRPVTPTYPGPEWPVWMVQDQHFVDHRDDVLSFSTDPLTEDLTITGNVVADLFASTSGTDSDWIVKLIDVCPADSGYNRDTRQSMAEFQLMVNGDVLRARFRDSMSAPKPVPANVPVHYTIDLRGNDHVFRKKHRIMAQVQSTWFPVYDRNPQTYVDNIFKATAADYRKAVQRVYHSPEQPSAIILPVNTLSRVPADAPDSCYPPVKFQQPIDTGVLDNYSGTYQTGDVSITITRAGDQLSIQMSDKKGLLEPLSDRDFYFKEGDVELTFAPVADGKARAVTLRDDSGQLQVAFRTEQ